MTRSLKPRTSCDLTVVVFDLRGDEGEGKRGRDGDAGLPGLDGDGDLDLAGDGDFDFDLGVLPALAEASLRGVGDFFDGVLPPLLFGVRLPLLLLDGAIFG